MALIVQIFNTDNNETTSCGNIHDFCGALTAEIGGVATVFTSETFKKRASSALVRLFQKIRDERVRDPKYKTEKGRN